MKQQEILHKILKHALYVHKITRSEILSRVDYKLEACRWHTIINSREFHATQNRFKVESWG